jgi:hypothetical protein
MLLTDNIHAELDAFITNKNSWTRNELSHFMLALSAERAIKRVF